MVVVGDNGDCEEGDIFVDVGAVELGEGEREFWITKGSSPGLLVMVSSASDTSSGDSDRGSLVIDVVEGAAGGSSSSSITIPPPSPSPSGGSNLV